MTAMNEALYFLRLLRAEDLMGVNTELLARIDLISRHLTALVEAAWHEAPDNPAVMINRALAAKITDGAYDAGLLRRAIAADAGALEGLAQIRLGRMLFELPTILGGDIRESIILLEQATAIAPDNLQAWFYLAESYEQEFEQDKAAAMRHMLPVERSPAQRQMAVDMLRLAQGLSRRMGDQNLAEALGRRREVLLASHPELLSRVSIAVGGHGGEHPLDAH